MKKLLIAAAIALAIYWLFFRKKAGSSNGTPVTQVQIAPVGTYTTSTGEVVQVLPGAQVANASNHTFSSIMTP